MSQQLGYHEIIKTNENKLHKSSPQTPHRLTSYPLLTQFFAQDTLQTSAVIDHKKSLSHPEQELEQWASDDWQSKKYTEIILANPVQDMDLKTVDLNHTQFTEELFNELQFEWVPFLIRNREEGWQDRHKHFNPERLLFDYEDSLWKVGEDDDGNKVKMDMKTFMHQAQDNKDDSPLQIFCHNFENQDKKGKKIGHKWHLDPKKESDELQRSTFKKWLVSRYKDKVHSDHQTQIDKLKKDEESNKNEEDNSTNFEDSVAISDSKELEKLIEYKFNLEKFRIKKKSNLLKQFYLLDPFKDQDQFRQLKNRRPPQRWFLFGPQRSGSGVHQDPLSTSAWNTLVHGHKLWIMIHPSVDEDIVKGREIKKELKRMKVSFKKEPIYQFSFFVPKIIKQLKPDQYYFFVQQPGETIFVPQKWWHAVLNLDDTIAYTQNLATDYTLYNNLKNLQQCKYNKFRNLKKKFIEADNLLDSEKMKEEDGADDQDVRSKKSLKSTKSSNDDSMSQNNLYVRSPGQINRIKGVVGRDTKVIDKKKQIKLSLSKKAEIVEMEMQEKKQDIYSFDTLSSGEQSKDSQDIQSLKADTFITNEDDYEIVNEVKK